MGAIATSRNQEFATLDRRIRKSVEVIEAESLQLSRDLLEMARDRDDGGPLWTEGGWPTFKSYLENLEISAPHFRRLRKTGQAVENIEERSEVRSLPVNAGQLEPLLSLQDKNPEAVPKVWDYAVGLANDDDEDVTSSIVEAAVREYHAKGGNLQATRRKYSERERELKQQCEDGWAVVANTNTDHALISWAEEKGKYVYVGRGSKWGNPYQIPGDGDRKKVCWCYEKHYIEFKGFKKTIEEELSGKVLGCYCSPEPCHADELAARANGEK